MSLSLYKKKRDFSKTPEPKEAGGGKKSKLSFVVQRHAASHLHYDFRLEMEGVLKSWAVPKGPSMKAGEKRLAVMVEDHPLPYGKFFGVIPKGNYGAGIVEIWDSGTYIPMDLKYHESSEKESLKQLKKGDLKFVLDGKYLKGAFALVRMGEPDSKNWLLIKKKDEFETKDFDIENYEPVKPVKAGKSVKPIPRKNSEQLPIKKNDKDPEKIEQAWKNLRQPMLAKLSEKVVDSSDWIYEVKYDGYRALTKIHDGKVEMLSRNGNSFNHIYTSLIKELSAIKDQVILDGEIVIEDEKGVSNFQLLQNYKTSKKGILKYYIFDILFVNGYNVSSLNLHQRKELLDAFFENNHFKHIIKSEYIVGKGENFLKKSASKGYEGIIAKNLKGTYLPAKRTDSWLKIKNITTQEVVIAGYTSPQNSRKYFGSLILGVYHGDELKYIGNCGTGFTEASLKELHEQFEKLKISACPFKEFPKTNRPKGKPTWLKPTLVCNIKFLEWTSAEHIRNAVFNGLRIDKDAKEVIRENKGSAKTQAIKSNDDIIDELKEKTIAFGNKKVKCTNLTKIYWPKDGITKGDLIDYYQKIATYILPYLKNRPLSLNRHPNGIVGESFYQKDMDVDKLPDWVKTAKIYSKSNNKYIDYLICNDEATLVYMANLGCIEINPWHSLFTKPDDPSYMMLDLDPGDISFVEVTKTALVIKDICDELDIECYCKTSGASGLHIYIPLGAKYTYDEVKIFAELLAHVTHQRLPKTTSIERIVAKRKDKIYIDFLQNRKGQTIAAPYSVRPRPHATVSTPLLWKEVNDKLTPEMFTMHNMLERLDKLGDLWKDVLGKPIVLSKVLKKIESI